MLLRRSAALAAIVLLAALAALFIWRVWRHAHESRLPVTEVEIVAVEGEKITAHPA